MIRPGMENDGERPRRGTMTRKEVAEYLGVSTRTVQRIETRGILRRCPALGSAVRFPIGDVLKLASADWKER